MKIYNLLIKDFGNGRKQVKRYSKPISVLEDDFEFMARQEKIWENATPDMRTEDEKENDRFFKRIENNKRAKTNVYDICRSNEWDYFLTLTFSPDKVNRYDYSECLKKLQRRFENIRNKYAPDMKYVLVPELHKDGAVHFHGLISGCNSKYFEPAINPQDGSFIYFKGNKVYNWNLYTLGYATATAVLDTQKVSFYITKYLTKQSAEFLKGKRRFLVLETARNHK